MTVKLLDYIPLDILDHAVGKCWGTGCKNSVEERDKRLYRVVNKHKHGSISEHVSYVFDIDGISRACLQELARHRHQSLTVKSSRYTLKQLKDGDSSILNNLFVHTDEPMVDAFSFEAMRNLQKAIKAGISNDIAKYCMPESMKTSLISTFNMRSLQNFLALRTSKTALLEIRDLANNMFDVLPEDHKFMLIDSLDNTH